MEPASTPEQRVRAYIRDWHRNWSVTAANIGGFRDIPHDHALREREVQRQHFVEESVAEAGMGWRFSSPPDHDPGSDTVLPAVMNQGVATVETQRAKDSNYFEFELVNVEGDWRIRSVARYYCAAGEPVFTAARRAELLAMPSPSALLPELPMGDEPNCHRLFEDGRRLKLDGHPTTIKVHEVGMLALESGIIGVADFGYGGGNFLPLARSVPGGIYRVQQATGDSGTVIAARVIFQDGVGAVEYRPAPSAEIVSAHAHCVGVDAGNVAIFDARPYVHLEARELDRLYLASCNWGSRRLSSEEIDEAMKRFENVTLAGVTLEELRRDMEGRTVRSDQPAPLRIGVGADETPNGYKFSSGHGDGSYPVYWGLDSSGAVVDLTVDFLVAAEQSTEKIKVPWSSKLLGQAIEHPVLKKWQQELVLDDEDGTGYVSISDAGSDRIHRVRLLGLVGRVLADSDGGGSQLSDDDIRYYLNRSIRKIRKATLEIVIGTGYRN